MISPVTTFIFDALKDYVTFLQKHKLAQASTEMLRLQREAKLPLLELFAHLGPEDWDSLTRKSLTDFFEQVLTDTALQAGIAAIDQWKDDQIPGLPREKVQIPDIVLSYSLRRRLLLEFLPEYTTDCSLMVQIMREVEEFHLFLQQYALEIYIEIQQAQLQQQNEFLSSLIRHSVDGILALDQQMRVTEWNPALETRHQIKREALLGKNIYEVFSGYAHTEEANATTRALAGEEVYLTDRPSLSGKGWYDAHVVPLYNNAGKVNGCLSIIRDITARKEAEMQLQEHREELQASNEELQATNEELETMNEELHEHLTQLEEAQEALAQNAARLSEAQAIAHLGSWEYDHQRKTFFLSEEMQRILGYPSFQTATNLELFLASTHPHDQQLVQSTLLQSLQEGNVFSLEYRIRRSDGSTRWILARGETIVAGKQVRHMRGTCLDITERKEAEIKLAEEKYFISKLTDASPDVITLYDLEQGKNIYSSREVYSILGYSKEELAAIIQRGQEAFADYFHPDDLPGIFNFLESYKTYREDAPRDLEYRIKNAAGEWVYILDRYNVFKRNDEGLPVQIIGIARNVTDTKKAEASLKETQQFIQLVTESVPNIIYVYDLQAQENVYVNREMTTLLGYTPEQIKQMGNRMSDQLIHPDDIRAVNERATQILADQDRDMYELLYRVKSGSGEWRWLRDLSKLFKRDAEGNPWQILGITEDITERKRSEEELQQINFRLQESNEELVRSQEALKELANELEVRVEQRTAELSQKNEQLQRINADLDNFVYTASHDLRTPIANLEGFVQLLMRRTKDKLTEQEAHMLGMMNDSIIRLNRTIADLTDIARMQKDLEEVIVEKVSFADILTEVQYDMHSLISESEAVIDTDFRVADIYFSAKNLRSLLYNLLNNALKYRSPDRNAEIKIETQEAGPFILLCVTDNGLGIASSQQQKIFSLFKRAHTHVSGSGVGLYIVKRIIENSGGRIELESQPEKGSTFKLYIRNEALLQKPEQQIQLNDGSN